jgi:hypothetical protein
MTPQSLSCLRLCALEPLQVCKHALSCIPEQSVIKVRNVQELPSRHEPLRRNFTLLSNQLAHSQAQVLSLLLAFNQSHGGVR